MNTATFNPKSPVRTQISNPAHDGEPRAVRWVGPLLFGGIALCAWIYVFGAMFGDLTPPKWVSADELIATAIAGTALFGLTLSQQKARAEGKSTSSPGMRRLA